MSLNINISNMSLDDITKWCNSISENQRICQDEQYWKIKTSEDFGLPVNYFIESWSNISPIIKYKMIEEIIKNPVDNLIEAVKNNDDSKAVISLMYIENEDIDDNLMYYLWDIAYNSDYDKLIDILNADGRFAPSLKLSNNTRLYEDYISDSEHDYESDFNANEDEDEDEYYSDF